MKKYVLAILFIACFHANQNAQEIEKAGLAIGQIAPDFNLKGIDGKMHSLASIKNAKAYLVVFTCNHCPFSQAYENRIIAIHKKFVGRGIPVIAINPNDGEREPEDNYDNMVKRAKEHHYPFLYLLDADQSIAKAYGAKRTPQVFLMDANKKLIYTGAIDDNFEEPKDVKNKYLENAIKSYLAQQTITTPITKAIGCGIKWKKK